MTTPPVKRLQGDNLWALSAALLLLVMAMAASLPLLGNGFINYDDPSYVTANAHVQGGFTWEGIKWAFHNDPETANWHPLTWMSHMVDWALFGTRAWGHHLVSLLLHGINMALVFLLLRRMTGMTWRSFAVAALWGLHPLRVESVAWAAERKDVLSAFFFLLSLLSYLKCGMRNSECGMGKASSGSWIWYGAALGFFALGLMSKPMVVTLPFVLVLLDYWPLRTAGFEEGGKMPPTPEPIWKLVLQKWPFFLPAGVSALITVRAQAGGGAMEDLQSLPVGARVVNALISYCRYLGKMIVPRDLCVIYPLPEHWPAGEVISAAAFLALVTILVITLRRRAPYLAVGWFWFLITLLPVIGLVQVGAQAMADRYTYLPMIGILVMVVWGVSDLLLSWRQRIPALAAGTTVAVVICGFLTWRQAHFWKDSETLFRHAVAVMPDNDLAWLHLGDFYSQCHQPAQAVEAYRRAVEIFPNSAGARNNYGNELMELGRFDEAIAQFREAVKLKSGQAVAINNLGLALLQSGRAAEAVEQFEAALKLRPGYTAAMSNLGSALLREGRLDDAAREFEAVLAQEPGSAEAHNNLGSVLASKGDYAKALGEFRSAAKLEPSYAAAHRNVGGVLLVTGKASEAATEFRVVVGLTPEAAEAHANLGMALAGAGRREEAIGELEKALKLQPGFAAAEQELRVLKERTP